MMTYSIKIDFLPRTKTGYNDLKCIACSNDLKNHKSNIKSQSHRILSPKQAKNSIIINYLFFNDMKLLEIIREVE
jgi:hypothetical protein